MITPTDKKKNDDYPEMTTEIAEKNNVVAAECCAWCSHHKDINVVNSVFCKLLHCTSYCTDVCNKYHQD